LNNNKPLIKAENISKKFCKSLKRSLWYGIKDSCSELSGQRKSNHKLRKNEFWALDDISFELHRGECLGLIGRNGAGKSTLLKLLNGLIKPDVGQIEIRGRINALIELGAGFNPILSGYENIYINGAVLGFNKKSIDKKIDSIIEFSEIGEFLEMPVQNYSSGMYVRLGFAIAAHLQQDVLLIDEILAVGDIGFRSKCYNAIHEIRKNTAVVFVSHSMNLINRICTKVATLERGKNVYSSSNVPAAIQHYYDLFSQESNKPNRIENYDSKINFRELKAPKYKNLYEIEFGADITIEIDAHINPCFKNIELNFTFLSHGMDIVAQCNSHNNGIPINNSTGHITGEITIKNINFNKGNYFISMSIVDSETNNIIIWDHLFTQIKIAASFYGGAFTQLVGDWSKLKNNE